MAGWQEEQNHVTEPVSSRSGRQYARRDRIALCGIHLPGNDYCARWACFKERVLYSCCSLEMSGCSRHGVYLLCTLRGFACGWSQRGANCGKEESVCREGKSGTGNTELILKGFLCCPCNMWKQLLVVSLSSSPKQQEELKQVRNSRSESWEQLFKCLVS